MTRPTITDPTYGTNGPRMIEVPASTSTGRKWFHRVHETIRAYAWQDTMGACFWWVTGIETLDKAHRVSGGPQAAANAARRALEEFARAVGRAA